MQVPEGPGPEYHQLHAALEPRFGVRLLKSVLGLSLMALFFLVVSALIWQMLFALGFALAGKDVGEGMRRLTDLKNPTPMGLAHLLLVISSSIPAVWVLTRVLHGLKPGWSASVFPRIRWRFFAVCLGLSVVALVASVLVGALTPQPEITAGARTTPNPWTTQMRDFLLVIVLLTPLQAAGEEYVFRGYLTQVCGGVFSDPRVARVIAVLVPSLLFAAAHGSQNIPLFLDRFAFGVVAGVLVIITGGLEAGIALHVVNNCLAFSAALFFGDMATALQPGESSWWAIVSMLVRSVLFVGLAAWVARRMGLSRRADWGVLVASGARVYSLPSAHHGSSGAFRSS